MELFNTCRSVVTYPSWRCDSYKQIYSKGDQHNTPKMLFFFFFLLIGLLVKWIIISKCQEYNVYNSKIKYFTLISAINVPIFVEIN